MRRLLLLALALLLSAGVASVRGLAARPTPATVAPARQGGSALLVTIDTLRADVCSGYGDPLATTPNLDRLARSGLLVERAYSATDRTNPSHATIMTGLLPAGHGVYNLRTPLPAVYDTLAEGLARRGVETAAVVSVQHLDPKLSGLDQGFDCYEVPDSERSAEQAVARARDLLGELRTPFLLWVHLYDPHMPYEPAEPYRRFAIAAVPRRPVPDLERILADAGTPLTFRDWLSGQDLEQLPALYRAEVMGADAAVGQLAALVRRRAGGVGIVVTADHGEGFGEHGVYWNHFGLFEEMLRVPLVAAGRGVPRAATPLPGIVPSTAVRDLVEGIVDGDAMLGPVDEAAAEMHLRGAAALVAGRYKLVDDRRAPPPLPRAIQLYDLAADPGERSPLAAAAGPRQRILEERLEARLAGERLRGHGSAVEAETDADTREKLRALGYAR